MGDDDKGNRDGTRGGGGLVLRGGGGLTTYAEVRGAEALALRTGWHGEEMPPGMSLGRMGVAAVAVVGQAAGDERELERRAGVLLVERPSSADGGRVGVRGPRS